MLHVSMHTVHAEDMYHKHSHLLIWPHIAYRYNVVRVYDAQQVCTESSCLLSDLCLPGLPQDLAVRTPERTDSEKQHYIHPSPFRRWSK